MRRRSVAPLAWLAPFALAPVVALLFVPGCSYAWDVAPAPADGGVLPPTVGTPGATGTTPGDPASPPKLDASTGSDAAATATITGECGTKCACKDNQTCAFTCKKSPCALECTGTSTCKIDCAAGENCNVTCKDKAKCDFACTGDFIGNDCALTCEDDATCTGTCKGFGLDCTRACKERKCDVNCSASASCKGNGG